MKPVDVRNESWADVMRRVDGDRAEVYRALQAHGPATTRELAADMRWDRDNVRPRMTELFQIGLVKLVGKMRHHGIYAAVPVHQAQAAFERAKAGHMEQVLLKF